MRDFPAVIVEGLMTVNDSIDWTWSDVSPVTGEAWQWGGEWRPGRCEARYHMAVIIPFRDRDQHLIALLRHLIPVLQRQMIHFRIFVVEQVMSIIVLPYRRDIKLSFFSVCFPFLFGHRFLSRSFIDRREIWHEALAISRAVFSDVGLL